MTQSSILNRHKAVSTKKRKKNRKTEYPVKPNEFGNNVWDFVEELPGESRYKYVLELFMPSGDILMYGAWFCHSFDQALEAVCHYHAQHGTEFGTAEFQIQGCCNDEPCNCASFHTEHGYLTLTPANAEGAQTEVSSQSEQGGVQ